MTYSRPRPSSSKESCCPPDSRVRRRGRERGRDTSAHLRPRVLSSVPPPRIICSTSSPVSPPAGSVYLLVLIPRTDVAAAVKVPNFAGLGMSQTNRRMSNAELRMSKAVVGCSGLSFVILRFGVLRFCGSPARRPGKEHFQTGVGRRRTCSFRPLSSVAPFLLPSFVSPWLAPSRPPAKSPPPQCLNCCAPGKGYGQQAMIALACFVSAQTAQLVGDVE